MSVLEDASLSGFSPFLRKGGHTVARAAAPESGRFPDKDVPSFKPIGTGRCLPTRRSSSIMAGRRPSSALRWRMRLRRPADAGQPRSKTTPAEHRIRMPFVPRQGRQAGRPHRLSALAREHREGYRPQGVGSGCVRSARYSPSLGSCHSASAARPLIADPGYCSAAASKPINFLAMATRGGNRDTTKCVLVVRRGARTRYAALQHHAETLPLDVVWDRRDRDRRTSTRQRGQRGESERGAEWRNDRRPGGQPAEVERARGAARAVAAPPLRQAGPERRSSFDQAQDDRSRRAQGALRQAQGVLSPSKHVLSSSKHAGDALGGVGGSPPSNKRTVRAADLEPHAKGRDDRRTGGHPAGAEQSVARAAGLERRRRARRQSPPFSWDVADFVVVLNPSKAERSTSKRKA